MSNINKSKAYKLLATKPDVKEKAGKYTKRIAKSIQVTVLDALQEEADKIEAEILSLEEITLHTDHNAGLVAMSQEHIQANFEKILDLEVKLVLVKQKLAVKQEAYDRYFAS